MKRFASHRLYISHLNLLLKNHVVEIDDITGAVTRYFPFTEEISFTEWLNGLIVLSCDVSVISFKKELNISSETTVISVDEGKNIRSVLSSAYNKTPLILKAYYITSFNVFENSFAEDSRVLPLL